MSLLCRMRGVAGKRPLWLAEDAVLIEPVCAVEFPIFGKIIGNFSKKARFREKAQQIRR